MAGVRVHIIMEPGLLERVDAALAQGQSRGEFVRRAVERALDARPEFVPASTHNALVEASEQALAGELEGDEPSGGSATPAEQPVERPSRPLPHYNERDVIPAAEAQTFPAPRSHAATCKCPVCAS